MRTWLRTPSGRPSPAMLVACAALFVALGGPSFAASTVQRTLFAKKAGNANRVDGFNASAKPRPNTLLALDKNRRFPRSVFPVSVQGSPGAQGPEGPRGAQGPPGPSTGPAGGDLTGSYPDPAIADGAVTTAKFDAAAKAPDADRLDGLDSTDLGLGYYTGRLNGLPASLILANGAPSGVTPVADTGNFTLTPNVTLSPNRPIVIRDLAVTLTEPVGGNPGDFVTFSVYAADPLAVLTGLTCGAASGTTSCANTGSSGVVPPSKRLVFVVSDSSPGPGSPLAPGTGVLFSWRAAAP
jgi:hypothetical protein